MLVCMQIGIDPPRGVLLYGPPGTGKTMLAKAVAHHTTAAFIRVVGSEFVQKYLGEGPRLVRDVFRLAKENAPAIIFIDEVDAIATARFDAQTGADREVLPSLEPRPQDGPHVYVYSAHCTSQSAGSACCTRCISLTCMDRNQHAQYPPPAYPQSTCSKSTVPSTFTTTR